MPTQRHRGTHFLESCCTPASVMGGGTPSPTPSSCSSMGRPKLERCDRRLCADAKLALQAEIAELKRRLAPLERNFESSLRTAQEGLARASAAEMIEYDRKFSISEKALVENQRNNKKNLKVAKHLAEERVLLLDEIALLKGEQLTDKAVCSH